VCVPVPVCVGCLQAAEVIKVLLSKTVMDDVTREGNVTKRAKLNPVKKPEETNDKEEIQQNDANPERKNVFTPLIGRQILYDASAGEFHNFSLPPRNLSCKVCGVNPSIRCMADSENNLKQNSERISEVIFIALPL
jgi:molybdopterin/thiamine biosynthesis adenylyltransferase